MKSPSCYKINPLVLKVLDHAEVLSWSYCVPTTQGLRYAKQTPARPASASPLRAPSSPFPQAAQPGAYPKALSAASQGHPLNSLLLRTWELKATKDREGRGGEAKNKRKGEGKTARVQKQK